MGYLQTIRTKRDRINDDRLLKFDSSLNQYIDLGIYQSLNYSGSFSFSCTALFDSVNPSAINSALLVKSQNVGTQGIQIEYVHSTNQLIFIIHTNNGPIQVPSVQLESDILMNLVFTWDQENVTLRFFVNGRMYGEILAAVGTVINNTPTQQTRIGSNPASSANRRMSGLLQNCVLYNRALTRSEVIQLHSGGGYIPESAHDAVLNHWPLTEKYYFEADVDFTLRHPQFAVGGKVAIDVVEQYNASKTDVNSFIGQFIFADQTFQDGDFLEFTLPTNDGNDKDWGIGFGDLTYNQITGAAIWIDPLTDVGIAHENQNSFRYTINGSVNTPAFSSAFVGDIIRISRNGNNIEVTKNSDPPAIKSNVFNSTSPNIIFSVRSSTGIVPIIQKNATSGNPLTYTNVGYTKAFKMKRLSNGELTTFAGEYPTHAKLLNFTNEELGIGTPISIESIKGIYNKKTIYPNVLKISSSFVRISEISNIDYSVVDDTKDFKAVWVGILPVGISSLISLIMFDRVNNDTLSNLLSITYSSTAGLGLRMGEASFFSALNILDDQFVPRGILLEVELRKEGDDLRFIVINHKYNIIIIDTVVASYSSITIDWSNKFSNELNICRNRFTTLESFHQRSYFEYRTSGNVLSKLFDIVTSNTEGSAIQDLTGNTSPIIEFLGTTNLQDLNNEGYLDSESLLPEIRDTLQFSLSNNEYIDLDTNLPSPIDGYGLTWGFVFDKANFNNASSEIMVRRRLSSNRVLQILGTAGTRDLRFDIGGSDTVGSNNVSFTLPQGNLHLVHYDIYVNSLGDSIIDVYYWGHKVASNVASGPGRIIDQSLYTTTFRIGSMLSGFETQIKPFLFSFSPIRKSKKQIAKEANNMFPMSLIQNQNNHTYHIIFNAGSFKEDGLNVKITNLVGANNLYNILGLNGTTTADQLVDLLTKTSPINSYR